MNDKMPELEVEDQVSFCAHIYESMPGTIDGIAKGLLVRVWAIIPGYVGLHTLGCAGEGFALMRRPLFDSHIAYLHRKGEQIWPVEEPDRRITSGPNSQQLWDDIGSVEDVLVHDALYSLGCKMQELEARITPKEKP